MTIDRPSAGGCGIRVVFPRWVETASTEGLSRLPGVPALVRDPRAGSAAVANREGASRTSRPKAGGRD